MEEKEKNKLYSSLTGENKNLKYIDIYLHLKTNLQNNKLNSICHCNSKIKYYCIPCKITCCDSCTLNLHKNHIVINMNEYFLNLDNVKKIFNNFNNNTKKSQLITDTDKLKKKIIDDIDNIVDEIINKFNKFRKKEKEEIGRMFKKLELNKKIMNENIENVNKQLCDYIKNNKKFFNLNENVDNNKDKNKYINNDIHNTYFLQGYDIIHLTNQDINEIYQIIDILDEDLENYLTNQKEKFTQMKEHMEKLVIFEDDSENKSNSSLNLDLNLPMGHFMHTVEDLGLQHFSNVKERINKYNKHINKFKQEIYKMIKTTGSIKEIEKNLKSLEYNRLKGAESLFSLRDEENNGINDMKNSSTYYNKKTLNSEDDICLNSPSLCKYFGFLFNDLYDKHFKIFSKELQSSHADLQIKKKDYENDEEDNDTAKVIEGTNEIHIFEKKNSKMNKFVVKLSKNPFGYNKFPIGCRSLLIGDKIYISGGKDENNEYPIVLIFDRRTKTLKRIMDLRIPRAYHAMVYSEVFNTIIILGGEGESSVEIFDPATNRWQLLPELNIPRANLIFYCDSPRGILYAMFGIEGKILENKYSDVIEFLDLKNIRDGWNILDYKNKSEIDLKTLMNIYPLNTDLILLYGGVVFRGNRRSVCIFNLIKSEITKINQKIMEELRTEAKKSKKLNSIISGLNSTNSSKIISNSSSKVNF